MSPAAALRSNSLGQFFLTVLGNMKDHGVHAGHLCAAKNGGERQIGSVMAGADANDVLWIGQLRGIEQDPPASQIGLEQRVKVWRRLNKPGGTSNLMERLPRASVCRLTASSGLMVSFSCKMS